jgi:cytochrome P450
MFRAILHDEERYPGPSEFKPERFLDSGDDGKEPCPDPWIAFGFGRRFDLYQSSCPLKTPADVKYP